MKPLFYSLFLTLAVLPAVAQSPAKSVSSPAAVAKKPVLAAKPTAAKAAVAKTAPAKTVAAEPQVLFSLKYIDEVVGTGPEAEPNKIYWVHYTGWLASDGTKFDSSYDHREPLADKDGKPVLDSDGNPKLGEPAPFPFPQGFGRVIAGWDQGFYGMHIGGKRKIFIPWQLAYGAQGRPPVIPAKADLVFEVELIKVEDLPTAAR